MIIYFKDKKPKFDPYYDKDGFWIEDDSHIDYDAMMDRDFQLFQSSKKDDWRKQRKKFLSTIPDQDRICKICFSTQDITVDHIAPRKKGGTHDFNNLQILCRPCNTKKGTK